MRNQGLIRDSNAADQVIIYAIVGLVTISLISMGAYFAMSGGSDETSSSSDSEDWIDPVVEIEDENHSHTDLLAHRLATSNMK